MESTTTRQKKEAIEEYLKKNGYETSSQVDGNGFISYYRYLLPRKMGDIGAFIKVSLVKEYGQRWYVTALIKMFMAKGSSDVFNHVEFHRVLHSVDDFERVNELADLMMRNKDLIMI